MTRNDKEKRHPPPTSAPSRACARLVGRALVDAGRHKVKTERESLGARRPLYYNTRVPLRYTLSYRRVRMQKYFLS